MKSTFNIIGEYDFNVRNKDDNKIIKHLNSFNIVTKYLPEEMKLHEDDYDCKLTIPYLHYGNGVDVVPSVEDGSLKAKQGHILFDNSYMNVYVDFTNERVIRELKYESLAGDYTGDVTEIGLSYGQNSNIVTHTLLKDSNGNPQTVNIPENAYIEVKYRLYVSMGSISTQQIEKDDVTYSLTGINNVQILLAMAAPKHDISRPVDMTLYETGGGDVAFNSFERHPVDNFQFVGNYKDIVTKYDSTNNQYVITGKYKLEYDYGDSIDFDIIGVRFYQGLYDPLYLYDWKEYDDNNELVSVVDLDDIIPSMFIKSDQAIPRIMDPDGIMEELEFEIEIRIGL